MVEQVKDALEIALGHLDHLGFVDDRLGFTQRRLGDEVGQVRVAVRGMVVT